MMSKHVHIPEWLLEEIRSARRVASRERIKQTAEVLSRYQLHTVCNSAGCPNRGECFSYHVATFLILGDVCTRNCSFCAVAHGKPHPPEPDESERLATAVSELGLSHAVITSVTRDDLPNGGAEAFAKTVQAIRQHCPGVTIELLIPDFNGSASSLSTVLVSSPNILAHNIETVPSRYRRIRPGADYCRSLELLQRAKQQSPNIITKSGIMLGLGETSDEIRWVLKDLAKINCDMITIGQYLSPSLDHAAVERYILPEEFAYWRETAMALGFKSVVSGSLVRSSYKASHFFKTM